MSHTIIPLKRGDVFASLDGNGFADPGLPRVIGLFRADTRHLSDYRWQFDDLDLLQTETDLGCLRQFWSRFADKRQVLLLDRTLRLTATGFTDTIEIVNEGLEPHSLTVELAVDADFADVFELRGRQRTIHRHPVSRTHAPSAWRFDYRAQDGVDMATEIRAEGFGSGSPIRLDPGERRIVRVTGRFLSSLPELSDAMPTVAWTSRAMQVRRVADAAMQRAFSDIEALTSVSEHGPYVVAGVPNFANPFGRDGLITAWFLLDAAPEIARGTLRLLAAHRGTVVDPYLDEEPGKIPHELRYGELARCGDVPFGRYYGTNDATSLFVILLRDCVERTGDLGLLADLRPALDAAVGWIERSQDDDGLVRYAARRTSAHGLYNTSWKDSDDSVFHADGTLVSGAVAVVEIQGYAAAALEAAADLYSRLEGTPAAVARLRAKADDLRQVIDARFWHDGLGLHALALDSRGQPCLVATSNPGHLLWVGALTAARAEQVAERLLRDDLWTGWGLRTVSSQSPRYQPLSYHNGSVWPHDTGIFAAGLHRYGLTAEARRVGQAIWDLARIQPGRQLPELCGGYARDSGIPPLTYIDTCRPQAWAAGALVWVGLTLDEMPLDNRTLDEMTTTA